MDRNFHIGNSASALPRSLSVRRAWIEMTYSDGVVSGSGDVALRKESVDRNCIKLQLLLMQLVALRKESVDRNMASRRCRAASSGRSP